VTGAEEGQGWLAREGPDFLERHDDGWFRRERWRALERGASGCLPLAGLWLLDWPAEPLAVFLLLGILGSLGSDWMKLAIAPQVVRERLWHDLLDIDLWRVTTDLQAGKPPVRHVNHPAVESPFYQLLLSSWMLLSLVGSLLYELRSVSGTDLLQHAVQSPEMLPAMLAALGLQAWLGALWLRDLRHSPRPERSLRFEPFVEAIMAFLVLLGWMVGSMVVVNAGGALLGRDFSGSAVAVLVVAAYALQVLRAIFEWRWLTRARDARRWLEQNLESVGVAGRISLA
jgi:hypothetical protein